MVRWRGEVSATGRRATVHDVAREAGVSLATVDRVLNNRPGVRPRTVEKVEQAIASLDYRRDLSASLLARARDLRVKFLLPDGSNEFMDSLAEAVNRRANPLLAERVGIQILRFRALNPFALAKAIDGLEPNDCDCAVVVATSHEAVAQAIDGAHRRGIAIMTLVSDLPQSQRRLFIGIDNTAAGKTAASLIGRFCKRGKVGLIIGSLALRDHRERLDGFRSVCEAEFPDLELIGPLESQDEPQATEQLVRNLLSQHPDLVGLYNLGAGNAGLLSGLEAAARAGEVRVIAHELSESTREGLRTGAIDVVLDQHPDREIAAAIEAARSLALSTRDPVGAVVSPIEIGVFLRDNLR